MTEQNWYIVKQASGQCNILPQAELDKLVTAEQSDQTEALEQWGPFNSLPAAIAKRVGLIRAGKCHPV